MKLRILSLFLIFFLPGNNFFAQWVQTNGPYGSTSITAFIDHDAYKIVASNCGLFTSENISTRWTLKGNITFSVYTCKGDSLYAGNLYNGVSMIDLSQSDIKPESFGLNGMNIFSLSGSDSCLFAGTEYGGFYKSIGFSKIWEPCNSGLPVDSGYIPPKFGGGKYYLRFVHSVDKNNQYVFAGTQRGIYRANPDSMIWHSINAGLPLDAVSFIKNMGDVTYICINDTVYKSISNGDSWEVFYTSEYGITSISEIENILYITTRGEGIFKSADNGDSWDPFNNGLDDTKVHFIGITDTTLICGTSSGGFYYNKQDQWIRNNSGIICSTVRSIVTTSKSLIANDFGDVYNSSNGNDWLKITPDVNRELFGTMASMGDTVLISVEYDSPSAPYDQPYILCSYDNGNSWNELTNPVPFARDDPYGIYCYKNRLYAYEDELMYYTDDLGSSWKQINLPDEYCNYFYDFLVFNSVPFAAACGNAELVKLNENENWIISNAGLPDDRGISGLAYCEGAIFAYVDVHGMYISRDDGNTWNSTDNGIKIEYSYGIRSFVPLGESIFITTSNGIYYSEDYGQKWHSINSGLVNLNMSGIAIRNDTLYAGTYGNGIWKCAINSIPLSLPEEKRADELIFFYPNPASDFIYISNFQVNSPGLISIMDLSGRKILSERIDHNELNVSELKQGTYIVTIISDQISLTDKLIISR